MTDAAAECLKLWKYLESHIMKSFPEKLWQTKLDAAGAKHYQKAGANNWESVAALMKSGAKFITDNNATLTTGGMPTTYTTTYTTAKTTYDNLYKTFLTAQQTQQEKRNAKINANNAAHKTLMAMFKDGQKIFRNAPATKARFTFSTILDLISGSGSTTLTIDIAPSTSQTIERAIANSPIINIGTIPVILCSGSSPCTPTTGTTINAGSSFINTLGATLTFTNTNATTPAQTTIRVVRP